MAITYPKSLEDTDSPQSEKEVFRRLAEVLDDEWLIFARVGWSSLTEVEGFRQGEVDIILFHPHRGALGIEVKGHGVVCENGTWYRDYEGTRERTKDPFEQAVNNQYALARALSDTEGLENATIKVSHCVIFPFTPMTGNPPSADAGLFISKEKFRDGFSEHLNEILDRTLPVGGTTFDQLDVIVLRNRLAPSYAPMVTLGDDVLSAVEGIEALTQGQKEILYEMDGNNRLDVVGFAGSGKTMLALAKAEQMQRNGLRALYVCFNRGLADEHAEKASYKKLDGLTIINFHRLASQLIERAGLTSTPPPNTVSDEVQRQYWDEEVSSSLMEAAKVLGPQFDAIIIDEAQDLSTNMFRSLRTLLSDPDGAVIWIFRDDSQGIFQRELELGREFPAQRKLTVNCRNTGEIHRTLLRYYQGDIKAKSAEGPSGRPVRWVSSDDQPETILSTLRRLKADEVPTQDIMILSPRPLRSSVVGKALSNSSSEFTFAMGRQFEFDHIRFESVPYFKGLESPVVIVIEWDEIGRNGAEAESAYVALSRANAYCVVVGSDVGSGQN